MRKNTLHRVDRETIRVAEMKFYEFGTGNPRTILLLPGTKCHWSLHGLVAKMAVKVNANKGGAWNNTWGVQVNPEGHDHGLAMTLVGCPLADFAKTHGYTEIMPWLCRADERTASAIHARLIRHHTVAQGHETCDYWYVGDQDPSV